MKGYIGDTVDLWWENVQEANTDKINYWYSNDNLNLDRGDIVFFLGSNARDGGEKVIVGGAFFEESLRMQLADAWEKYGEGNGIKTYEEFERKYSYSNKVKSDDEIDCRILIDFIAFNRPISIHEINNEGEISGGSYISEEYINKIIISADINYWAYNKYYLNRICHLASAERIANELKNRSNEYVDSGVISADIYSINSSDTYKPLLDKILTSVRYTEFKRKRKEQSPKSGLISDQALNRYLSYLDYMNGIESEDGDIKSKANYSINLGIGRVQNITANNIFIKDKSLYDFISSSLGKKYGELKNYCNTYYGKGEGGKYFGQIITPLNLLGLIEINEDEELTKNKLLDYVSRSGGVLPSLYIQYFLCQWQFPIPSTEKKSGRELTIFKPYCVLLKILLELNRISSKQAYLTETDFESIFLDIGEDTPELESIDEVYVNDIIINRASRRKKGIKQSNGSLTYIINTLLESDLLTNIKTEYDNPEGFYVGLNHNNYTVQLAEFFIREYGGRYYSFDVNDVAGRRDEMSRYGEYINNYSSFVEWRKCYMTITRIAEFGEYCRKRGFNYSEDLIRRFVMSLETKPFLLLTGISGSGKTKIAELWTRFLKDREEAEGLQISIGSNWKDNKKLLGFNNVLLEAQDAYQETELVRMLKDAEDSSKDFIIILDEMNLSRVEMYFADFLSALESLDHLIKLPDGTSVKWGSNVKIIGTVNVDESTYMFSPKVLDRANVIEMNGVSPRQYIESVKGSDEKIYKSLINEPWFERYIERIETVYNSLKGEFAYRVMDEMTTYIARNVKLYGDENIQSYVDEQICQKVLPKLHGSKAQLKPKLDKLEDVFGNENYPLVNGKIKEMQEDIKKGYTSFIGD